MKKIIRKLIYFFNVGVWEIQPAELPFYARYGINSLRTLILAFRGFKKDECAIRSSALTYFSLLSIVPVIAVAFAIAKGFGLEQLLEDEITKALAAQKEVMTYLLEFSKKTLTSTKGGLLAVISIGFLLYTVIKLFHHIENAVNSIWSVKKSRTLLRRFTDYLSIVIIAPIFLIASSAANVYIETFLKELSKESVFELITPFLFSLIKLLPFIIIWLLFSLMYLIMPNTNVHRGRAFIAGIVAGTVFQLVQLYYIDLQFAFSRYNAVYGSFAALPLFLIWLQFSWLIFLFGAEISSALDNIKAYGFRQDYDILSHDKKRMLNLLILKKITNRFEKGESAPDIKQLAKELKLPSQYVTKITESLQETGLINKVTGYTKKREGFQPSKDIATMSFSEAVRKIDRLGDNRIIVHDDIDYKNVEKQLKEYSDLIDNNYSQLLIKNIKY